MDWCGFLSYMWLCVYAPEAYTVLFDPQGMVILANFLYIETVSCEIRVETFAFVMGPNG